jgi:3-hydroxymyristoyl/3-hydroxydecanoyl-(acyl carrier protein) dehydratase
MNEIVTYICVPADHPSLAGHFPGHPIVPGVVLLDAIVAAIRAERGDRLRLASIVSTKFLRAIDPDTRVDVQITFAAQESGGWRARFAGRTASGPVLEGSLLLFDAQGERES